MKNPCAILPLMQALSATLADLDFAHERELQRAAASSADPALRRRVHAQLEARHLERREPYLKQLRLLEARIKAGMPDVRQGSADLDAAVAVAGRGLKLAEASH